MTTTIRSSEDGSKSYIAVGGTDRVTIDAATGKLTSTYSPPTGERSLALATMQKFADEFGASLAANGYQKLPSGLILQWGKTGTIGIDAVITVTFPIAFTTACYAAVASGNHPPSGSNGATITTYNYATTTMSISNDGSSASVSSWIAIGY